MIDALRSYLQLASGLAEVTAAKAKETATNLANQTADPSKAPEAFAEGLQTMAEDLVEQSRTNSEMLVGLVKTEVDRAVGRMGFVREEELAAVRRHVQRLETQIGSRSGQAVDAANSAANAAVSVATESAKNAAATAMSAANTAAKKSTTAAKSLAPEDSAQQTPVEQPAAKKAPVKKAPAKKTAAKKAPVKKAPAKKTAAKKAPVKKTAAKKAAVTTTTASKKTSS